ncbi:hypothetical protein ACET69_22930 [Aeromonas veronii]
MSKALYILIFSISFSPFSFSADSDDATLIEGASGVSACPSDRFCVYTNAHFNSGERGDVLAIKSGVQLNSSDLINFGFPVGAHDGVSAVVNNLDEEGTLVSGSDISGKYLGVAAGAQVDDLSSSGWNDKTNSIATTKVISVDLPITLPDTTIYINDVDQYATLSIENFSDKDITVGVDVTGTPGLFTIVNYDHNLTVQAGKVATSKISLFGNEIGRGLLNVTIKPPVGYINQSSNKASATIVVDEVVVPDLNVTQTFKAKWQSWWPENGWLYTYRLEFQSKEESVKYWKFSFHLPPGAHVTQAWLDSQSSWLKLNEEESVNGKVVLENTAGHIISPDTSIPLDIEVFYLDESQEHEVLADLNIEKIG